MRAQNQAEKNSLTAAHRVIKRLQNAEEILDREFAKRQALQSLELYHTNRYSFDFVGSELVERDRDGDPRRSVDTVGGRRERPRGRLARVAFDLAEDLGLMPEQQLLPLPPSSEASHTGESAAPPGSGPRVSYPYDGNRLRPWHRGS